MNTAIQIEFEATGSDETRKMLADDQALFKSALDIERALKKAASPTEETIVWDNTAPFKRHTDPAYIEAITAYASHLHVFVARLITPVLTKHVRCPEAKLPCGPTEAIKVPRDDQAHDPRFRIAFSSASLCQACGPNCHIVNGRVYKSCPYESVFVPFSWHTKSNGKDVQVTFNVTYRFLIK